MHHAGEWAEVEEEGGRRRKISSWGGGGRGACDSCCSNAATISVSLRGMVRVN